MPLQKCFLFKEVYRKDFLKNTSSWFSDHNSELGLCTGLVYREDCWQNHAHMEEKVPGWEDDDIKSRQLAQDAGPDLYDDL